MTSKPRLNPLLADEASAEGAVGPRSEGQGISAGPLEPSSRPPFPGHRTASSRRESMEIMERVTAVTWVVLLLLLFVVLKDAVMKVTVGKVWR